MSTMSAAILALALGATAAPMQASYDSESRSVDIPRVEARDVKLDGTFSSGEWDGAVRFRISKDVELYLAADDAALRVGLRYAQPPSSVDLFLTSDRREFLNLHASMGLGETRLTFPRTPETGLGRLEMGRHVDWDANHMVKDALPVDGFEFRILRKRLGADVIRLALQTWSEDKIGYPAAADLRSADGWVELALPPVKAPAEAR